jgi:hypothetical protein
MKPCPIPFHTKTKYYPNTGKATEEEIKRYQIAIGNLNHLAIVSRPDISFALNILSQFVQNPSNEHWNAVIQVYGYILGTANHGIKYDGKSIHPLAFVDANHGGHISDDINIPPRSISGNAFVVGGGAISWMSRRQKRTTPWSFDSEYIALREVVIESDTIRQFYNEIGTPVERITIYEDNDSVLKTADTPKHSLTKAVNIDYHIVKEHVEEGEIELHFIPGKDQPADCLTKPVGKYVLTRAIERLGVGSVE